MGSRAARPLVLLAFGLAACGNRGPVPDLDAGLINVTCTADSDCADRVQCTTERCVSGECVSVACNDCCGEERVCLAGQGCRTQPQPCIVASDCYDGIDCTADLCASNLCLNVPSDAVCSDDDVCLVGVGCVPPPAGACTGDADCTQSCAVMTCAGPPEFESCQYVGPTDCDDEDACTVDGCDAHSGGCTHTLRDADGDGATPDVCGGDDCDDSDAAVGSNAPERCNGLDDNCNGFADEGLGCPQGAVVSCASLGLGSGDASCPSDCSGYDTSACDPDSTGSCSINGTYTLSVPVTKKCARIGPFFLINISINTMTLSDSGSALSVTTGPVGPGGGCSVLTGDSAADGSFQVVCDYPGTCTEKYKLSGTYNASSCSFTGDYSVQYVPTGGSCFDCNNQSWSVIATK